MPRMRCASRSGWNGSRPSVRSPVPMKLIGRPVTLPDAERRAAAGVAVHLGQHQAGDRQAWRGTPRRRVTASWPVMASTTSSVSAGVTAPVMRTSSSIIASSMCRRPAVSRIMTSTPRCRRRLEPGARHLERGRADRVGCGPRRRSGRRAARAGRRPRAGRRRRRPGAAACPSLRSRTASLAAVVVLPEPCRPTSIRTVGLARRASSWWRSPAEDVDQLVVDDLDDLLAGLDPVEHVGADRLLADVGHEVLDDLEVDVGLEQGEADLAQRRRQGRPR